MKYQASPDDGFGLRYSTCNEDNCVELAFLNLNSETTAVAITGSTGRVLNLLTRPEAPKKLVALDANVAQNYLLELKVAAITCFDYSEYIEFLGLVPSDRRGELFGRLQHTLSEDCRNFWRKHMRRVERGVLFEGRYERFYRLNGKVIAALFGSKIEKVKRLTTLDAQRKYYREHWDGPLWKFFLSLHSSSFNYKYILRDPIFFEPFLEHGGGLVEYARSITSQMATRTLLRKNPYFWLLLSGSYDSVSPDYWPDNLREENFDTLKSHVGAIEYVHGRTDQYFKELAPNSVDSFSLADIGNCMPPAAFDQLVDDVLRVGKPGARFVLRHSYGEHKIGKVSLLGKFQRFDDLEREMAATEHTCSYTFTMGAVNH